MGESAPTNQPSRSEVDLNQPTNLPLPWYFPSFCIVVCQCPLTKQPNNQSTKAYKTSINQPIKQTTEQININNQAPAATTAVTAAGFQDCPYFCDSCATLERAEAEHAAAQAAEEEAAAAPACAACGKPCGKAGLELGRSWDLTAKIGKRNAKHSMSFCVVCYAVVLKCLEELKAERQCYAGYAMNYYELL